MRLEQPFDALAATERAINFDPENVEALLIRGDALSAAGRGDDSVDSYRTALALAPRDPRVWQKLGEQYLRLERYESAQRAFRRGLELDGQSVAMRVGRSAALIELGHLHEALEVLG